MDSNILSIFFMLLIIVSTAHACVFQDVKKRFIYIYVLIFALIIEPCIFGGINLNVLLFVICAILFWIFELAMKGIVRNEGSMWLSVWFGLLIL